MNFRRVPLRIAISLDLLLPSELTLFVDTDSTIGVFRGADPDGVKKYLKG
jgi:hypothetical protein